MITKIDYQAALDVQTACNLSGVLHSFVAMVQRIPPSERQGHPICRLFAEQVMYLSGGFGDSETYGPACAAARERAK